MGVMTDARSEMHREFVDDPDVVRYTRLIQTMQEVANDPSNSQADS